MKLSIIMDRYDNPYAGTESQVLKLVNGLMEQGWDIQFAVLRGTDYTRSGMFPVPVHDLGVGSISSPGSWFKMYRYARLLRKQGFSVVHAFFNDTSVIAPPMMRLAGLKTLISRRDMGFWYSGTYLKALRLTGRCVHAAVCNSKAVAEITSRFEKMPLGKIQVISNGYPDISSGEQVTASGESRFEAEVVVGIVANLRPIKRIEDLIEAIGLLAREGLHLKLNDIARLMYIPISPPRVDSSKGSPLDQQGKWGNVYVLFLHVPGPLQNNLKWIEKGQDLFFFSTNPDLANILRKTDFNLENFFFDSFGFHVSRFPDYQSCGCRRRRRTNSHIPT